MRNLTTTSRWKKSLLFVLGLSVMLPPSLIQARLYNNAIETEVLSPIVGAKKINPTTVEILFPNSQRMTLDFYGENIFRVFQDNSGSVIRDPQAKPAAPSGVPACQRGNGSLQQFSSLWEPDPDP